LLTVRDDDVFGPRRAIEEIPCREPPLFPLDNQGALAVQDEERFGPLNSITNAAQAGMSPAALMARSGHSDFKTTQGYIDLAGETFREEADLLDARLFGQKLGQK
jgi:hypothetical protein